MLVFVIPGTFIDVSHAVDSENDVLTSTDFILNSFLVNFREKATNVLSRSPMDWNITRPSGMPASAKNMQNNFPPSVAGVEWP